MARQWHVGDRVRASLVLRDVNGDLAAGTVVGKVQDGAGTETTPSVTTDSTGKYHMDFTVTDAGTWYVRFNSTGAVVAADEQSFSVQATQF